MLKNVNTKKQSTIKNQISTSVIIHTWSQFHQNVYVQLLHVQIPKAQKDSQVISVFLHFWNLHAQKLLIKCW